MKFLMIFLIHSLLFDSVAPFYGYHSPLRLDQLRSLLKSKFRSHQFRERFRDAFQRGGQLESSSQQSSPVKERINDKFVKRLSRPDQIESRILLDFLADPSIFVTMLSSLEQMYMTFPFGFLLKPIVNFFRVPNRRRKRSPFSSRNCLRFKE